MAKVRQARRRHLRHDLFARIRKLDPVDGALARGQAYPEWLGRQSSKFAGTETPGTVSAVNTGTDSLTVTAHGLATGAGPFVVASTGTIPGGLAADTLYWVTVVDANTIQLHRQRGTVLQSASRVDITSAGSGTITIRRGVLREAIFEQNRRARSEMITAATDIDELN